MSKKLFVVLILASIVLASIGSISAQQISQYGILDFAEPFAREGETMICNGCYHYQDQPYWVVAFTADNNIMGEIVINANTGEVIKDENIARKIIYASCVINSIDQTVIAEDISSAAVLRGSAAASKDYSDTYREIANDPHTEKKLTGYANNAAASNQLIKDDYSACASLLDEIIDTENQFAEKSRSVEITELYLSKSDQFAHDYEILDGHIDKVEGDTVVLYDALITNTNDQTDRRELENEKQYILNDLTIQRQTIGLYLSSWESYKSDLNDLCEWEIEDMKDRFELAETPGFGAIFTIVGLFIVISLSRRRQ